MNDESARGRGRPKRRRKVREHPPAFRFEPQDISIQPGREVRLTLAEAEALRLADLEAIYHEEAAGIMDVSRSTYGRILESARHKVALALWGGMALVIDGGAVDDRNEAGEAEDRGDQERPGRRMGGPGGGRGRFQSGGGAGCGAHGVCICPRCGLTREHLPGRPCKRERCPDCGVALVREGGEHHRAVLELREKKK